MSFEGKTSRIVEAGDPTRLGATFDGQAPISRCFPVTRSALNFACSIQRHEIERDHTARIHE